MAEENSKTKYLNNVLSQSYFGFSDGKAARNLEELYTILNSSPDSIFYEHVNDQKNDFSSWIKYCVFHVDLANILSGIKDRKQFIDTLKNEIENIKNIAQNTAAVPAIPSVSVLQQPQIGQTQSVDTQEEQKTELKEEVYDFEDIFKGLIDDLEHEIMATDS